MQFIHPEWFHGLWLVLGVWLLWIWAGMRKRRMLAEFGIVTSRNLLIQSHSFAKSQMKRILIFSALVLIILTLAQPQWGEEKRELRRKGVDLMFLVDTSLSMLAEDTPPSRIGKAKLEMKSFLRELKGDRIGIVTFAGTGFVQSPLTLDYDAFILFSNAIEPGYIPDAGTSLSEAIRTAIKSFPETKQKYRAIILLSDGEHLEGDMDAAIELAQEDQVRIYTVGIGTAEGAPIPLRSEKGQIGGYKKDRNGEVVITKLDDLLLKRIANETGGVYFPATPGEREVSLIYQHMQSLEKKEFKQKVVIEREDHFQSFLFVAIILFTLEMAITETRKAKAAHVAP